MPAEGKRYLFEWREALLSEHGPKDANLQHVLLVLSLFADSDSGNCWPSQRTLADKSRRGLNTVNRKIKDAKKLGWITVSKVNFGGQGWKRGEYSLSIPANIKRKLAECSKKGVPTVGTPSREGQENQGNTHHSASKPKPVAGLQKGVSTAGTRKGVLTVGTPSRKGQENKGSTHHSASKPYPDEGLREGVSIAATKVFPQRQHNSLIELPTRYAFSDKSEKAPAGGRGASNQTPKPHFSEKAGDYLPDILAACQKIGSLPQKKKAFNAYQWVQHQTNRQKHPGAILESLQGLIGLWDGIDAPWAYADTIMKTKNGNYNERDAIAEAKRFKSEWVVNEKVRGLIRQIGSRLP